MTFLKGAAIAGLILATAFILGGCGMGHGWGHHGHYRSSTGTVTSGQGANINQTHDRSGHYGY